jgi:tRNA 2-thiocytidine biosynthesis protein TtcA
LKTILPQMHFSRLMRAIVEFNLINDGDHILIGLSGGKDSIFLTYALSVIRLRLKKEFTLGAITIDPMFTKNFPANLITDFCKELDIPHYVHHIDINGTIEKQQGKNPCFTCAFFRRGAINRFAKQHGYNKIAYAHHNDDAVETFLMNLLYSGQIKTFMPKTYLDRSKLTVIRPLIYFRENDLRQAASIHGFTPITSPCPLDGHTTRQTIKNLIVMLSKKNPLLYEHLAAGMRQSALGELWPPTKTRDEMKDIYMKYMYRKK